MSTGRVLTILLALLAGLETAAAQDRIRLHSPDGLANIPAGQKIAQQGNQQLIGRTMALQQALRYSPGSQGLDVTLMQAGRPVYAVKLKTGNRVHRVLVDARTGQVIGN